MSKEQQLRDFILENYLFTDDQSQLDNSDSFLGSGILDSMGILEMIHFLSDNYGIEVEGEEMIPENLDSINNLLAFIDHKLNTDKGLG